MPAYTIPFPTPPRVTGPGSQSPADITLPDCFFQQVNFSNGGATRYMILVNGPQANTDPSWNPAGGTPSTRAYLHVMKSADGGATWAEVGTPNAKELPQKNGSDPTNTTGFRSHSTVQLGNLLLVARPVWDFVTNASATPRPIVISQFDMDVDDWGPDLSSPTDPSAPIAYITHGLYPAFTPFFLERRGSDGHLFLQWRDFDFVNNSKSGTDLVIEASGASDSSTNLFITGGGEIGSTSYAFTPADIGKQINISNGGSLGFIPGVYEVTAVGGGNFLPDRSAGVIGSSGASWVLAFANAVSSVSDPFTPDDVGQVLTIAAHAGFNAGQYGVSAVDGGGIATVYHVGPPLNQTPGTLASSGATWSLTNQTRNYDRTMLSEFDGANWSAAVMVFGTVGEIADSEPAGLVAGDGDRIHLFAQRMRPTPNGNNQTFNVQSILSKTLTAGGALVGSQSLQITDRAPVLPFYRPYGRAVGGAVELELPHTFLYDPAGTPTIQNCELRLYRGMSADAPKCAQGDDMTADDFARLPRSL